MAQGHGWRVPAAGDAPLAGFSHGAAGISWALLNLSAVTGQARFREAALNGILYERSLFSPQAGNWPDLRVLEPGLGSNGFVTAWCHGAPGIGLGRLCSLPHLDDAAIRAEIDIALQTTAARGCGFNFSLCHGDLGNLELLLHAADTIDPRWREAVDQMAGVVVEGIAREGWRCGVPLGVETPGLMTGIAGIGYGLLRLAEPGRVPSVLTLAPPGPNFRASLCRQWFTF
jgi:lantibiotic modifying enzyme